MTPRPAVFLDRDGTINFDAHYVRRPEDVRLIPGAGDAIARLNFAGVPVIVISNQSGIGRGVVTMDDYERVRRRLEALLDVSGAHIDATYLCPHVPAIPPCGCRKPGTELHLRAAQEHDLDLVRSWFIGDRWHDVAPAQTLHGHGILVPSSDTPATERRRAATAMQVASSLGEAVGIVLRAVLPPSPFRK